MRLLGIPASLVILMLAACETAATAPPTAPLAPAAADLPAQFARFHGVWSGKWDKTWDVTFVVDQISSNGDSTVQYYWKEHVPGAWLHQTYSGCIRGDVLTDNVITITLDASDNSKAVAVGKFEMNTRTAELTKL